MRGMQCWRGANAWPKYLHFPLTLLVASAGPAVLESGVREAVLCDLGLHVTIRAGKRHDPKREQLARRKSQAIFTERIEAIITRDNSGTVR